MKYNAVTVTQLNKYIKDRFEEDENLNAILVKGEISNFKNHYTGHLYFTLKDENSLIKCIMFKSYAERLAFKPKDGMKVMVFGAVSVFERDGVYQIYAKSMLEDGMGDLHEQFEQLKAKLEKEGLFDETHKKPIPLYPKVVGVLTSQTGAVIRDIINVSTRRNPNVYIRLLPVPVQGPGAAEQIAEKIKVMNEQKLADVLIIGRGGGSLEDLWPFNEEIVARAIYESELPIISAVGHETDFTIADFVADLRAPTPSAAAELAVPDVYELKQKINNCQNRCRMSLKKQIELMKLRYEKCMKSRVFTDPMRKIRDMDVVLDSYVQKLENRMKNIQKDKHTKFVELVTKLDTLSPLKTLTRGYTITEKNDKIVKSVSELEVGDPIKLRFFDGETLGTVLKVSKRRRKGLSLWGGENMKKQKKQNLLTMVIILLVIALIMMIGSIVYEEKINMAKQPTQNPEVLLPKEDNKEIENEDKLDDDQEENQDSENGKNEQIDETEKEPEFVGEEENNTNEDASQSKDEKAINLVKKEYGNDDTVTYSIEQKNGIKYYVAVKGSDTETIWYEVDTETWEVSEY